MKNLLIFYYPLPHSGSINPYLAVLAIIITIRTISYYTAGLYKHTLNG
ncbi:hypothetical protein ACQCWA_09315 [Rossellomorea aquimaris]|nr:hypothetical protein [Bacillus sp. CH30_1T]